MKGVIRLLLALVFPLIAGCGNDPPLAYQEAVSVKLEKRSDGLSYEVGAEKPFTGEAVTFAKGLKRQSVQTWREGKPHGSWLQYWPTGKLKREDEFVDGEQVMERQWYEDGGPKLVCGMKNGVWFGRSTLWWPDGRMKRTSLIGADLKPHGHALEYDQEGNVLTDAIFYRGKYVSGQLRKDPLATPVTAQAH